MIRESLKKKFLEELEKSGVVQYACAKVGIGRATYYRWLLKDVSFRTKAMTALDHGRDAITDMAEQVLIARMKEKNLTAAIYILSHTSKRYKSDKSDQESLLQQQVEYEAESLRKLIEEVKKDPNNIIAPGQTLEQVEQAQAAESSLKNGNEENKSSDTDENEPNNT